MKNLSDSLKTIENLIWKYASYGFNTSALKYSLVNNSNNTPMAWVVDTTTNITTKPLDELVARLNKTNSIQFEIYRHSSTRIYIVPTTTEDEKYALLELKTYVIGQELAQAQQKVLQAQQKWIQPLKDLAQAKKTRETA